MCKKGFTLIELLVVIAVIALLMGILMPALHLARDQGRKISCMSNMRQVGLAFMTYQNEYEKTPPKTQTDVFDFASPSAPPNALKLLRPMLSSEDPNRATPIYACPGLKPHPDPVWAPTRMSFTGYYGLVHPKAGAPKFCYVAAVR